MTETTPPSSTGTLREVAEAFNSATERVATALSEIKNDLKQNQAMRRLLLLAIALDLCVTIATAVIITLTLNNNTTVNIIRDCTQATGKCYQRNAQTTANALTELNDGATAAAYCAQQNPNGTFAQVKACVTHLTPVPAPTPTKK